MNNPGDQQGAPPPNNQPYNPPPANMPPQQPQQYVPPQGYAPQTPQPQQGYPPMQAPAPPKKRSPLLFILAVIGAVVLICVVGIFLLIGGIFAATQPVVDAGDAYMTALRDGNYSRAFDLSTTALQQEVGDASGLEAALSAKQPSTWTFTSRSISNDNGQLSGTATYKDGTSGTVDMSLTKVGNDWKVVGINMK